MPDPIITVLLNLLTNPIVIGLIVFLIVFLVKSLRKKDYTQEEPKATETPSAPAAKTSSASSGYSGTSKIFVNGGSPASGDKLGTISVDGKSLTVLYSEAPLEITVSAGTHHVVVEGGVYGDARIDRSINLGVLDVWTIDLPGGDDADLIRHQMISSSEYRSSLSRMGLTVTRRSL